MIDGTYLSMGSHGLRIYLWEAMGYVSVQSHGIMVSIYGCIQLKWLLLRCASPDLF